MAVLFAPGAQPAQAQSTGDEVWSATLTVQQISSVHLGCNIAGSSICTAALTDNTFRHNNTEYVVRTIILQGGTLQVSLNKTISDSLKSALILHVGNSQFPLADGTLSTTIVPIGNDTIIWSSTGLSWSANQQVSLRLIDPPPPSFSFKEASLSVHERDGQAIVTVIGANINADISMAVTAAPGTAMAGDDYTGESWSVDFPAGVTSAGFIIPIVRDGLNEGAETFTLTISPSSDNSYAVGTPRQLRITIHDNPSKLTLSASGPLREGGGPVTITYTLDQPAPCYMSATTPFSGTASVLGVENDDYLEGDRLEKWLEQEKAALESIKDTLSEEEYEKRKKALEIDVGHSPPPHIEKGGTTATQTLVVIDDDDVDHGETLVLWPTMSGCDIGLGDEINFAIKDNERKNGRTDPSTGRAGSASPTRLTLSADNVRPGEGDSAVYVTAKLDKPATSGMWVTISFSGTATRGGEDENGDPAYDNFDGTGDYHVHSGGGAENYRRYIHADSTNPMPMAIFINDDGEVEGTETITLTATVDDNTKLKDTLTLPIRDNDRVGVTVSPTTLPVGERDFEYYTVKLNSRPTADVTVTVSSSNTGTGTVNTGNPPDPQNPMTTLTFTPTNWGWEQRVRVTRVAAGTATITQRAASDDRNYRRNIASVTVTDLPAADPAWVYLSVAEASVAEDTGAVTVTARVRAPTRSAVTVTAKAHSKSTATATDDYTGLPATITIPQGRTTGTATVTIVNDTTQEGDETIALTGTSPGVAVVGRTLTITANDGGQGTGGEEGALPQPEESAGTYTLSAQANAAEGADAALTITLSDAAPEDGAAFTVTAGYGDGGATADDVGSVISPVTAPEGSDTLEIAVPTVDDAYDEEDETFTVTVVPVTAGWQAEAGRDTATVTITDDDTAGVTVTAANPLKVEEGGSATYTVVLDSRPTHDVIITAVNGDPAKAAVIPAAFTIAPENWNVPETFTVNGLSDDDSGDETVSVSHRATSQDDKYAVPVASVIVAVSDATPPQEQNPEQSPSEKYAELIKQMKEWRNDPQWVDDKEHTDRWDRALLAFGETVADASLTPMTAAEAQEQPNRAPTVSAALGDVTVVNGDASGAREVSLSGVFSDADDDELTISAASSDETVALAAVTDDQSDVLIIGDARGTATVTVTADDGNGGTVSESFTVTVKAAPVVESAISDVTGLEEGATQDVSLTGVFRDGDGDDLTITATSSDDAKATVSVASGGSALTLTGVAEGTATISVTAEDSDGNRVSDAFDVSVAAPAQQTNQAPSVSAAIPDATIVNESGTKQVSLSGVFDDADDDTLTVTAASSAEAVATVSVAAGYSSLTVTAKARGTAAITVTASDGNGGTVSDSFTVKVKAAPVVVSAIGDLTGLTAGSTQDISLTGVFRDADADADNLTITAASSDEARATVTVASDNSKLTVAGVAEGTATITVTAQDADGNRVSDTFNVMVEAEESEPSEKYAELIAQMKEWRNDPEWVDNKEHTDRWDRSLLAFGEEVADTSLTPMTAAEAQELADRGWSRWERVAAALREIEGG